MIRVYSNHIGLGILGGLMFFFLGPEVITSQEYIRSVQSTEDYILYTAFVPYDSPAESNNATKERRVEENLQRIQDQVATYVRGYIQGIPFTYHPHSNRFGVNEEFIPEVSDIAQKRVLDRITNAITDEGISLTLRYTLSDSERLYRATVDNGIRATYDARGRGTSPEAAFFDALRVAVREPMRKKVFNKPKKITGFVVLHRMPREYFLQGKYVCEIKVSLLHISVSPYEEAFF